MPRVHQRCATHCRRADAHGTAVVSEFAPVAEVTAVTRQMAEVVHGVEAGIADPQVGLASDVSSKYARKRIVVEAPAGMQTHGAAPKRRRALAEMGPPQRTGADRVARAAAKADATAFG